MAPCSPASPLVPADPRLVALGAAIRRARNAAGLSQEALAAETGIDRSFLGHIERGAKNPSFLTLCRIADGVGIPPEHLVAETFRPGG